MLFQGRYSIFTARGIEGARTARCEAMQAEAGTPKSPAARMRRLALKKKKLIQLEGTGVELIVSALFLHEFFVCAVFDY